MPLDPKQQPPYYTPGTQGTIDNKYRRLNAQFNTVVTSGTTETDLYTYTIPANTLINNGDALEITQAQILTVNSEDHESRFYFNTIQEVAINETVNRQTIWKITIIKTGTTTALIQMQYWTGFADYGTPTIQIEGTTDFTIPIPIKFTGQCTGLATIQTYYITIDKITI